MKNKKLLKIWLVSGIATSLLGCNQYKLDKIDSIKEETPIVEYDQSKMNNGTKDILFQVAEENENLEEADLISLRKMAPWIDDNPYFDYEYAKEILKTLDVTRNQTLEINTLGTYSSTKNLISYISDVEKDVEFHELVHALLRGTSIGMKESLTGLMQYEYMGTVSYPEISYLLRMIIELVGVNPVLQSESSGNEAYLIQALKEQIGSENLAYEVYNNITNVHMANLIINNIDYSTPNDSYDQIWLEKNIPGVTQKSSEELRQSLIKYHDDKYSDVKRILYYAYMNQHKEESRSENVDMEMLYMNNADSFGGKEYNTSTLNQYKYYFNSKLLSEEKMKTKFHFNYADSYDKLLKYDTTTKMMMTYLNELSGGELTDKIDKTGMLSNYKLNDMLNIIYGNEAFIQGQVFKDDTDAITALKMVLEIIKKNQKTMITPLSVVVDLANELGSMEQAQKIIKEIELIQHYSEMIFYSNQSMPFSKEQQEKYRALFPNIQFLDNHLMQNQDLEELNYEIYNRNVYLKSKLFLYSMNTDINKIGFDKVAMTHYICSGSSMGDVAIEKVIEDALYETIDNKIKLVQPAKKDYYFIVEEIGAPCYFFLGKYSSKQLQEKYEEQQGDFEIIVDRCINIAKDSIEKIEDYSLKSGIQLPDYGLDINTKRK